MAPRDTIPESIQDVELVALVIAPAYQPEVLRFPIGIPCDLEDVLDAVERHVVELKLPFTDRFLAVRPQPIIPGCATVLLAPAWAAYASVAAVCLDMRDTVPGGVGPIAAAFVTRPTCKAELCRQAGIFGFGVCQVFIGTSDSPLADDEAVHLANGCLVTFVRRDVYPVFANDLQYRLQMPHCWPAHPTLPALPSPNALLLLHDRGRFLFRPQASQLPIDEAAVRFVGVAREDVDLHAPAGEGCGRLQHQGVSARGIIAVVSKTALPEDQPTYVVFLDLRQVAQGVKFLVLARPFLSKDELQGLVTRRPPPGWRLRVLGGRMRRDRVDIQTHSTLTFGFEYDDDSDQPPDPFSPTTDDGDSEGGESSDGTDDQASQATTRSRSRRGRRCDPAPEDPSSDHSYHGSLDALAFVVAPPLLGHVDVGAETTYEAASASPPYPDSVATGAACADCADVPACLLLPDFVPALSGGTAVPLQPVPEDVAGDPPGEAVLRADFFVFSQDFVPEHVSVVLDAPATLHQAHQAVNAARDPAFKLHTPRLVEVFPQPDLSFGTAIAVPEWGLPAVPVLFDTRRLDGRMFCTLV